MKRTQPLLVLGPIWTSMGLDTAAPLEVDGVDDASSKTWK